MRRKGPLCIWQAKVWNFLGGGELLLQDSESFYSDVVTTPANAMLMSASAFHRKAGVYTDYQVLKAIELSIHSIYI